MESLATQSEDRLGGSRSVLVRQKRDHIALDELLRQIDGAHGRARQELLTRLCRLVFPHAFAEESVLWPLVRRVLPDGEELTLRIEREHQEINELFTELERLDPDSSEHRQLFDRIAGLLRQDVRDEEDDLLPKLQDALPRNRWIALGVAWEMVRRTAPTRPHPVVARRPPGNVVAAAPLTVTDRLRDRLDQVARRAHGAPSSAARHASAALAAVAGRVEHLPPLTRGERPETHT
ncbi:hemerythrin domain-containing protein [Mycolicibacterium parafortuitum]|uniref:hemerythrin domain-containing protein n=1 Tax=Mycolicibacterium parafortuitum TaxID=39692 RepID=UPI0032C4541A